MDGVGPPILTAIVIGALFWLVVRALIPDRGAALRAARAAYDQSLAALKERPTDPEVKQRALALGRAYSNLTREKRGVTVYDEVALANDIGAASAGAAGPASVVGSGGVEARLAHLLDLRANGLVTAEEYQAQRARILGEI